MIWVFRYAYTGVWVPISLKKENNVLFFQIMPTLFQMKTQLARFDRTKQELLFCWDPECIFIGKDYNKFIVIE